MKNTIFIVVISILLSHLYGFSPGKMPALKLGRRLDPNRVVLAINCGNKKPLTSADGFVYQEDVYHMRGPSQVATYWDHPKVPSYGFKYTEDHELHRIERWAQGPLQYHIPLTKPEHYVLILKFSEVNFMSEGSRVFNIKLGKDYIKKGFDIMRGGHAAEVNLYIPFELNEQQQVIYNGLPLNKALQQGLLQLGFEAVADNPKVNGII